METLSPYFSTRNDIDSFNKLVEEFGLEEARKISIPVYADDFRSLSWEVADSTRPYTFSYFIRGGNLVHESNRHSGKDILDCVRKDIRGGLEYRQTDMFRQSLLAAEIGATTVWISPKKTKGEDELDCYYDKTQVNVAEKVNEGEIRVRQFQSRYLDLPKSSLLLSMLSGEAVVRVDAELDELMLTLGGRPVSIRDEEVHGLIKEMTGFIEEYEEDIANQILKSQAASTKYLHAIEEGITGEVLDRLHKDLLKTTIDYRTFQRLSSYGGVVSTSCGIFDFGKAQATVFNGGGFRTEVKLGKWCQRCGVENSCTSKCYKCNGELSNKPQSYI